MLKIDISARHMDVTDAMRSYTEDKLGSLDRYLRNSRRLEVVVESNASLHAVEVIAHIDNVENIVVKKEDKDFYACVDKLHDVLEKRFTQIKEKNQDRRKKSARFTTAQE